MTDHLQWDLSRLAPGRPRHRAYAVAITRDYPDDFRARHCARAVDGCSHRHEGDGER